MQTCGGESVLHQDDVVGIVIDKHDWFEIQSGLSHSKESIAE